jgi:hypothetical protein
VKEIRSLIDTLLDYYATPIVLYILFTCNEQIKSTYAYTESASRSNCVELTTSITKSTDHIVVSTKSIRQEGHALLRLFLFFFLCVHLSLDQNLMFSLYW